MIYLRKIENESLENEQVFVFKFEDESGIGVGFESWHRMSQEQIDSYDLKEEFDKKIIELKSKRDEKLTKTIFTVSIDGVQCSFYLRTSDLPAIDNKIKNLSNTTDTKTWGDINGKRINLNKVFFEGLKNHIGDNDETIWDLYGEKLEELEALAEEDSTTLEDIKNFNTNLI